MRWLFSVINFFSAIGSLELTQRAMLYRAGSSRTSAPYSVCKRCATTSNCNCPKAPKSIVPPVIGRKTWIAPSSPSCRRPVRNCLLRIGSAASTIRKISGAKNGRPVNCKDSPSVKVSPKCKRPWLGNPIMSPGKASSNISRRCERKERALFVLISLPLRTIFNFMPRWKWPEQIRKKATRSRCAGSIFAWILKTTAEHFFSSGLTSRWTEWREPGAGARSTSVFKISRTPKLLMAEPKNTGDWRPAKNSFRSKAGMAFLTKSTSAKASSNASPKRSFRDGSSRARIVLESSVTRSSPALKRRIWWLMISITPAKDLPIPTGQVKGTTDMPKAVSISSIRSRGLLTSRSILLMNVTNGVCRARHTSIKRRVCGSTPLAASITIRAESTAVNTR